jgi:hypothetical protein
MRNRTSLIKVSEKPAFPKLSTFGGKITEKKVSENCLKVCAQWEELLFPLRIDFENYFQE